MIDKSLITYLEDTLEQAKKGEINSVFVMKIGQDSPLGMNYSFADGQALAFLGGLDIGKAMVQEKIFKNLGAEPKTEEKK